MKEQKKHISRYYVRKESGFFKKEWVVLSKATRTGKRQSDDLVEFRGSESGARKDLETLRKGERKELSKKA